MINQEIQPQGKSPLKIILIIVGILVVIAIIVAIVAGVYWYRAAKKLSATVGSTSTGTTSSALSSSSSGAVDTANFQISGSQDFGYTIYYPAGWKKSDAAGTQATIYYSDEQDATAKGVTVSIFPVTDSGTYTDIQQYLKAQPAGDEAAMKALANTTYVNRGVNMAQTLQDSPKMNLYTWICGGKIMTMTYEGADYNKYLPQLNAMLDKFVPCAG